MDFLYYIGAIGVMIWSFAVQSTLKSRVKKGSTIATNKTANEVVAEMLREHDIYGITIEHKRGEMTDCYSPKEGKIYLSDTTYNQNTVSAIAIAAHECGHAIQDSERMLVYRLRQLLAPVAGLSSRGGVWLAMIGLVISGIAASASSGGDAMFNLGYSVMTLGIIVYIVSFLFYLFMLPVERNASSRALKDIKRNGYVRDDQLKVAKKLLRSAGDTYAIALASSAMTLLRLLLMRRRYSGRRR